MGYLYENSNPERFQQLCQSLLLSDFPSLQCLPVGQPDGGRDGWDPATKTVLQVKFKRKEEPADAKWMISALEGELPKIKRLIVMGATNYVMITNAPGTAHSGGGSIDLVQAWLDENVAISAMCLWRDDVDRRIDAAPLGLKLKYAELLSLEDGIQLALEGPLGPLDHHRHSVVRAFVASQFDADSLVKFKQVNLSNELLDLFIDVPIGFPTDPAERNRSGHARLPQQFLESLIEGAAGLEWMPAELKQDEKFYAHTMLNLLSGMDIGAAQVLLGQAAQDHLRCIVLEGAPGQGKSTLAQYVCQVHRARYLNKSVWLARIPEAHKRTAFRIPIKIDLRDLASYLEGHAPYGRAETASGPLSLEGFVASLISGTTGGLTFSVDDTFRLLTSSPVLLFLDGLDEVADIEQRRELVETIVDAHNRLVTTGGDLQVIVTSRPSIFGKAPSFRRGGFATLRLDRIDDKRIDEYSKKWAIARGLDAVEASTINKILALKRQLEHIRYLMQNPMQLTILLSLIHSVGHSLPDQRTDLYRRYVELFLTREAEKSTSVREHRMVLIGFIQHLAWLLQSQAESSRGAGSISASSLQDLARQYLSERSHPLDLADELFSGGLERIFVLVQRIEGLYEFEVQPLREFFCARHLYETSPVGTYRDTQPRGDRAQRFEAIAASPFWLNVTRFYAGSYESGEIGSLVLSVKELVKTGDPAQAIHARRVGSALLQDWVFSNKKYAQAELIDVITDPLGLDILTTQNRYTDSEVRLAADCGQDALRARVFARMAQLPRSVRASRYARLLRANGGELLYKDFLNSLEGAQGHDLTNRIRRMALSGSTQGLSPSEALSLISRDAPSADQLLERALSLLAFESRAALGSPEIVDCILQGALNGYTETIAPGATWLGAFLGMVSLSPTALFESRNERPEASLYVRDSTPPEVVSFVRNIGERLQSTEDAVYFNAEPVELWGATADALREVFGDCWAAMSIAVRTAGLQRPLSAGASVGLFDAAASICARARVARLRRGGPTWWLTQLDNAAHALDRRFWAALVLAWASPSNVAALREEIITILGELNDLELAAFVRTLRATGRGSRPRSDRRAESEIPWGAYAPRYWLALAAGFRVSADRVPCTSGAGPDELSRWMDHEDWLARAQSLRLEDGIPGVDAWLEAIEKIPDHGVPFAGGPFEMSERAAITPKQARALAARASDLPIEVIDSVVAVLERSYRAKRLTVVADAQGWSFE
ncbi:NACHT domain-containing NTPase [Cellulomonas sp. PhB150]|uniref:NACHT domain-containing protein n=1 Tax=Cellulomonas sp. PhB150 TaxID=2485188 RepID=UPI000FA9EDAC|nr:hypothetical protein [Cellulomonas sp. PhB150]ROS21805.1 hypothetical protein EDF34_3452 [Cellulomonas sp. PhB150]